MQNNTVVIGPRLAFILLLSGFALSTNAALNITALSPANGATNVCPDTVLRITFDAPPRFTNSGVINIYTSAGVPMDTNDMALCTNKTGSPNVSSRRIAGSSYFTFPIIVSGNTATIFPHLGVLTTNQTYYVKITSGLFTNSANGAFAGIADTNTWSFTTKATKPPTGTNVLEVAADGTGDFCTVQGAVDFLPTGSSHVLINIHKGIYQEIVLVVSGKNNLTFRGEDRKQTLITYANNENLNTGSSLRSMMQVLSDDVAIENLTLTNSTPKNGSQAEALRTNSRRFICNNCDLASFQDTLLLNSFGRYGYYYNCRIQGDVDFIWNDGVAVFQDCEIKCLNTGYICQMRSDPTRYGAVFLDCMLTKASSVTGCYLNRIDPSAFPNSAAAYINCKMDTHILPVGWRLDNFMAGSPTNNLRFWEYQSTDLGGTPLNVSGRAGCSRQLNAAEANAMRNLTNVYAANLVAAPIVTQHHQPADQPDSGSGQQHHIDRSGNGNRNC